MDGHPAISITLQQFWNPKGFPSGTVSPKFGAGTPLTADVSKCKAVLIVMLLGVTSTPLSWREITVCCATEECRGGFVLSAGRVPLVPRLGSNWPAAGTVQDSDRPVAIRYWEQVYTPATTVTVSSDCSVILLTLLLQQEGNWGFKERQGKGLLWDGRALHTG